MSTDKITSILQKIRNDRALEDHFFARLATASKPLEWLVPLLNAGYFEPDKNPRPEQTPDKKGYYIPHWSILGALENMAIQNEEAPNDGVSKRLLEIVDRIIAYREDGKRIENYRTDWMLLRIISHLPMKYIGNQHIEFVQNALRPSMGTSLLEHEIGRLFLPKLIKEEAIALIVRLLDVILHYRKSGDKHSSEYISVIDQYYLREILDRNKKDIAELCAVEAANVGISKIREILNEDNSQFNYVWIPTIEDHEQTRLTDRYECQLVRFVRDMLEGADPSEIAPIVKDALGEEHSILKRLAYHVINRRYGALSYLLWSIPGNPIDTLTMHELYELFKTHCKSFSHDQIKTILDWVETQEFYIPDDVSDITEKQESIRAYYKKEWLLSLLDCGDKEVIRLYREYNSINDARIEHPGFHYWSSGVGWVRDVSPINEDEFKKKTNAEIAAFINAYRAEEDQISWDDFTRVNLASSVRAFVSNDPVRFSAGDLTPFLSVPRKYQYEFLRGFEEAWRNDKDFDWSGLLPFMKSLIEETSFWSDQKTEGYSNDYNRWIVNTIADLIQEGTKNDRHAFSPSLLPIAEEILLLLLKETRGEMLMMIDLITSVLNASKGKVFIAAINYSLRYARLHCQDTTDRWVNSVESDFTTRLDKEKEPGLEFSTVVGWYLPYLSYLNREWVINNINRIFDLDSDKHWEAAFVGHIVQTSTVHEDLYELLRDNGHYEKAISWPFADGHAMDKLVQNIAIGYLAGWDSLEDANGLLNKLLQTDNPRLISELVDFMWLFRDRADEEIKGKVKPLWKAIIEEIGPNLKRGEYRSIASRLGKWLSLVDAIDDDIYELLLISMENMEERRGSGFLIEYLLKHVKKTPEKVGNLYLTMLNAGTCPDYRKEDIAAIVQALYDSKETEKANRICNIYFSKGFEFLSETFRKNA